MQIRARILLEYPDSIDPTRAVDEINSTIENAIGNGDWTFNLETNEDDMPIAPVDYSISVEEIEP